MSFPCKILRGALLAILAAGCSVVKDASQSASERDLQMRFSNVGKYTWLGLVLPDGGPTQGEDEVWLCGTEADTCTLRVREVLGEIELVAWSLGRQEYRTSVDLGANSDGVIDLSVEFKGGGSIIGKVNGWDGGTAGDALIEIRKHTEYPDTLPEAARRVSGRTGDAGEFLMAGFGPGRYSAMVTAPVHAPLAFDFEMGEAGIAVLDVELSSLEAASTLRGYVFDAGSLEAVGGFEVELADPLGKTVSLTHRFESADGVFEWPGLSRGNWDVSVSADGFSPFRVQGLELPPEGTAEERFGLEAGRRLQGQVVEVATGVGIPGASVSVLEPSYRLSMNDSGRVVLASTRTGDLGRFDIQGLPHSPVSVMAVAEGYIGTDQDILYEAGGEVEIGLSRGATLIGQVTGADRPGALVGADVTIWPSLNDGWQDTSTAIVDETGEFAFQGLAPGTYTAELNYSSGQTHRGFDIGPGDTRRTLQIDLPERQRMVAEVRGHVSGLVPGEVAKIELRPIGVARVDPRGYYEMDVPEILIRPRTHITLSTSRGRRLTKSLPLTDGDSRTVNFALNGTGRLRGRVTRRGTPVRGAVVEAHRRVEEGGHNDEWINSEPTSREGGYEVPGVSDGEYVLFVEGRQFRISVNGDTRFDADLCEDPVEVEDAYMVDGKPICDDLTISGRVDSVGRSLSHVSVVLLGEKLLPKFVTTDNRGVFEFAHLIPGEYRLSVHRTGFQPVGTRVLLSTDAADPDGKVEVTVPLTPGSESPFWVNPPGHPPGFIILEVKDDRGERLWFPLPLDGTGRGLLPLSLAGRDFFLKHPLYEPMRVRGWRGQDFDVTLSKCRQASAWHRCLGWPWQETYYAWPFFDAP